MVIRCEVCGKTEKLFLCAKCKDIFYCSKDHQSLHWKEHKLKCILKADPHVLLNNLSNTPIDKSVSNSLNTIENVENVGNSTYTEVVGSTFEVSGKELTNTIFSNVGGASKSEPLVEVRSQDINIKKFSEMSLHGDIQTISHNGVNDEQNIHEDICKNIIRDMTKFGLFVIDNFLGKSKGLKVLSEVIAMHETGVFKDGQLVSSNVKTDLKTIRSDKITWVDGRESFCKSINYLINQVDAVIMKVNKMPDNKKMGDYKINGRTKAMIACYPGNGTHYVKHVDNPNKDGRCITAIYYLNRDWNVQKDGGLLRIFPQGVESKVADISPLFDRLLLFWSDRRNPHEVQPANATRYAITLWYFDAAEREQASRRNQKDLVPNVGVSDNHKT